MTVLTAWLVVAGSGVAAAQGTSGRPSRPYRGLFAGGVGDASQLLTASLTASAGRDAVSGAGTPAASGDTADLGVGSLDQPTTVADWSGSLDYSLDRSRVGLSAQTTVFSRYFPDATSSFPISRSAAASARWRVLRHTNVSLSFDTTHQPLSALSFFPGLPNGGAEQANLSNYVLGEDLGVYTSDEALLQVTQALSRRTSLVIGAGYQHATLSTTGSTRSVPTGSISLSRVLTRNLQLHVGYTRADGTYGVDAAGEKLRYRNDSIDGGLEYNGSLTVSRRATLTFRTGSALVSDRMFRQYRLTGSALFRYEIGRTWEAALAYDRQAGFVQSLDQPSFTDSVTTDLSGLLSRRIRVHSSFGAAAGDVGLHTNNSYVAYHGGGGLSTGLSRYFNFRVDYSYYRYRSATGVLLPTGAGQLSGNSVTVGLETFAPLIVRARRGNASR